MEACSLAAAHPDEDGYVRKVKLAVADQSLDSNGTRKKPSISYFDKPIHGLILVMSRSEEDGDSQPKSHKDSPAVK